VHDLSLYLLEVLENSVRAGATRVDIGLLVDLNSDELRITVDDNGRGLTTTPRQTLDPFYTTKRGKKVGLGLSLFRADAQAAGGDLKIGRSINLKGTLVNARMRWSHVDRPPLGDMAVTIMVAAATNPGINFTVSLTGDRFPTPLIQGPPSVAAEQLSVLEITGQKGEATTEKGAASMTEETEKRGDVCQGCEEASEEELFARLDDVIERYQEKPGALIPVLQLAQGIFGYLPEPVLKHIAKSMRKPYSEVAGVVGFYSFFSTVPRGRNLIRVCLGTACYVRGGMQVLEALKKELDIDVGETTEDQEFSLEVARCFGACGLAPVITVNDVVHHRVKPARINEILAQYSSGGAEELAVAGVGERSS
jgi:NADH:ubiquinone oxidoreductase subunit E